MTTSVKHVGSVRTWEGKLSNWEAHKDTIKAYCEGGTLEVSSGWGDWQKVLAFPAFHSEYLYRVSTPKQGEVWHLDGVAFMYIEDLKQFHSLAGHTPVHNLGKTQAEMEFKAACVEEYFKETE